MGNPFRRKPDDLGSEGSWSQRLDTPVRAGRVSYRTPTSAKIFRVMAVAIWPVAFLLAIGWMATLGATGPGHSDHGGDRPQSPTRPQATVALRHWLDQKHAPLPGGRIVTWDRGKRVQKYHTTADGDMKPRLDLHRFTVSAPSGLYTATLTIASTGKQGGGDWQMVGQPGLTTHGSSSGSGTDAGSDSGSGSGSDSDSGSELNESTTSGWPGMKEVTAGKTVTSAIQTWAQAFGGGTDSQLRQATGDKHTGRTYRPVDHATVTKVSIQQAAGRWSTAQKKRGNTDEHTPKTMIVRVSLQMGWHGHHNSDSNDSDEDSDDEANSDDDGTRSDWGFDVLVHDADTASPHVVAWGGPGTGPGLTPFQNAVPDHSNNQGATSGESDEDEGESGDEDEDSPSGSPPPASDTPSPSPSSSEGG